MRPVFALLIAATIVSGCGPRYSVDGVWFRGGVSGDHFGVIVLRLSANGDEVNGLACKTSSVYSPPVVGAVVTLSLDGSSTATDASGRFALITRTPGGTCHVSTLTIVAAGHPTYSRSGNWSNGAAFPVNFSLSPLMPTTWPGC